MAAKAKTMLIISVIVLFIGLLGGGFAGWYLYMWLGINESICKQKGFCVDWSEKQCNSQYPCPECSWTKNQCLDKFPCPKCGYTKEKCDEKYPCPIKPKTATTETKTEDTEAKTMPTETEETKAPEATPMVSADEYKQIWKNAGCTTDANYTDWTKKQTRDILIDDAHLWASLKDNKHRSGCYGQDESKWPLVSKGEYEKIWKDAGCTTQAKYNDWTMKQPEQRLIDDSKLWASLTDDKHRVGCYGEDQSKWPAP